MADFARILDATTAAHASVGLRKWRARCSSSSSGSFRRQFESVRGMAREITSSTFDFEAACNLGSLLAVLAVTSIELPGVTAGCAPWACAMPTRAV